jgi:hypothetical protein
MTPEDYEHCVAQVLRGEGWDARVTQHQRDFGVDIVAKRDGTCLGVQVKMFGGSNRPVAGRMVMELYGAAAYADCDEALIVTDGRILADAEKIAEKLGIEIRVLPATLSTVVDAPGPAASEGLRFGDIWREYVVPLAGTTLTRPNGKSNDIVRVDGGGLLRRSSNGRTQRIEIEIFRWAIERLVAGETVSRDEINAQYAGRASSGIALILSAIPLFESTRIDGTQKIRMRAEPPG